MDEDLPFEVNDGQVGDLLACRRHVLKEHGEPRPLPVGRDELSAKVGPEEPDDAPRLALKEIRDLTLAPLDVPERHDADDRRQDDDGNDDRGDGKVRRAFGAHTTD